jgi:hypothetical protein
MNMGLLGVTPYKIFFDWFFPYYTWCGGIWKTWKNEDENFEKQNGHS